MIDFQQTITSLDLLHTSLYRMELFMNAQAVKNAKTDVISLISRLEKAERERDELITQLSVATERVGINFERAKAAEAEIARRDAAAAGPVAWQYRYNDGKVGDWKTVDSESECNHSPCYERRAIYTDGKPAVLPHDFITHQSSWRSALERAIELEPESHAPDSDEKGYWKHQLAAFDRAYAELGAQKQNVVELDNVFSVNVAGVAVRVVLLKDVSTSLDSANVKYEVKP